MRIELPRSLGDGVVVLRPVRTADARAVAQAFRDDPELGVAIGTESDPDEKEAAQRIAEASGGAERGEWAELAITPAGSDELIGSVVLVNLDWRHRRAEVGFWLVPGARGSGIARRAVALALDWAFGELGMRRIELTTLPENAGAVRLAESLGFVREGLMRKRNLERGRELDVVWFGMLREEWRSHPKRLSG